MKHKLSLKAAAAYGHLIDSFVPVYMRDDFRKRFEEFLDAYDADSKPDITQTVQNFQREVAAEKAIQAVEDTLEHANFNGDAEKFFKANGLKFDEQRENSRLSELYKRFINNDGVNFFSARRRDDGSIEIQFEEIREV